MVSRRSILAFLLASWPLASAKAANRFSLDRVISHRGLFYVRECTRRNRENTMDAFRQSYRFGARYLETDCRITADGIPVLLHDDTVDRTTNGSGPLETMNYAELRKLNAIKDDPVHTAFDPVPTLKEFLEFCKKNGAIAVVEVKKYRTIKDIELMINDMQAVGDESNTIWCSTRLRDLFYIRNTLRIRRCGFGLIAQSTKSIEKFSEIDGRKFFLLNWRKLKENMEWIEQCNQKSIKLWPWTVNSQSEAEFLVENGCDMVISDCLK